MQDDELLVLPRHMFEALVRLTARPYARRLGKAAQKWLQVGLFIADLAASVGTSPRPSAAVDLVRSVNRLDDAQLALLRSIERQVSLLRMAPFRVGRAMFDEASRATSEERFRELIAGALERLREGAQLAVTPIEGVIVDTHIGIAQLLLGHPHETAHSLTSALDTIHEIETGLQSRSRDVAILRSRALAILFTLIYPVGIVILIAKGVKVHRAERARLALEELRPLSDALTASLQSLRSVHPNT